MGWYCTDHEWYLSVSLVLILRSSDDKKDADDQLDKEVTGSTVENVPEPMADQGASEMSRRKRKKKSYGKHFLENNDSKESDNSEENESMQHVVLGCYKCPQ